VRRQVRIVDLNSVGGRIAEADKLRDIVRQQHLASRLIGEHGADAGVPDGQSIP
jgi:hypothetical protein